MANFIHCPTLLAFVLICGLLLSGGCLEDAQNSKYSYDNEFDPDPDSDADSSGSGEVNIIYVDQPNDILTLLNQGSETVIMTEYSLKNEEADTEYLFPEFSLSQADFVRIHSGSGEDDSDDLYWEGGHSWQSGDSAELRDENGDVIDICNDGDDCWSG